MSRERARSAQSIDVPVEMRGEDIVITAGRPALSRPWPEQEH